MGFLTSLFGGDGFSFWSYGLALIIVLLLIVAAVWLLKLLFNATSQVGKNKDKRLAVIDTIAVDSKRNLILIRRDDVEHLVLVGGSQDFAVETGIPASEIQRAPINASSSANKNTSPTQRTADAVSRLGLTGLLRRYNTGSEDSGSQQSDPPANQTVPQQPTQFNVKQRASNPFKRNNSPASVETQSQQQTSTPENLGPLDRLKALGMRREEEVPQRLRHTGLLVPKDQNGAEPLNGAPESQFQAAEIADSANVAPTSNDLEAMSSIEQGPAQQNVQNGRTSNQKPRVAKAAKATKDS